MKKVDRTYDLIDNYFELPCEGCSATIRNVGRRQLELPLVLPHLEMLPKR
jgi:hypothetical protein